MQILQIFLLFFGLLNVAFAGSLYFHSNKNLPVTFYCLISLFASLWSLSTLLVGLGSVNFILFVLGADGHYIFGYLAYLSFFWFSFLYPSKIWSPWALIGGILLTVLSVGMLLAIPFTNFLFLQLRLEPTIGQSIVFNLQGYVVFILALSGVFVSGLFVLLHRFNTLHRESEKVGDFTSVQIYFAILSNFVAGILGITFNLLFPLYGNFSFFYINPIFVTVALTGIGFYNLLKYKLFNVRTVLAEFFTFAIWIIFFTRLISSPFSSEDFLINSIYLVAVVIFGIFLIHSVLQEVRQSELILKQEKELEEANKRQENLIHFITHEVKGYFAKSEAGFASIVEGDYGEVSPDLKSMATMALAEMRKGVDVVLDILSAGNFKKGIINYAMQPFDLRTEVVHICEEFKPAAEEKKLSFNMQILNGPNYVVVGDAPQLGKHVLHNLIDNAIKYTPQGTVIVSLSRKEDRILFSVKDSGVGITEEDKQHLFTEGGRGKDSIKVNAHSTGYGLFIAKSIVDAHHGKIWAQSEGQGKGSTFYVELPAKDAVAPATSSEVPAAVSTTPGGAARATTQ